MPVKAKRSTRKFVANHLGRSIKQRKFEQVKKRARDRTIPETRPQLDDDETNNQANDDEPAVKKAKVSKSDAAKPVKKSGKQSKPEPAPVKPSIDLDVEDFLANGLMGSDDDEEDFDDLGDDDDDEGPEVLSTDADGAVMDDDEEAEEDDGEDDEERIAADAADLEASLQAMVDADPEFYKTLQKDDPDLLKFSADQLDDEDEDDEEPTLDGEEDDEEDESANQKKKKKTTRTAAAQKVTLEQWKALKKSVLALKSTTSLRKAVRLFRLAAHAGDADEDAANPASSRMLHSSVNEAVIAFAVTELPQIFSSRLTWTEDAEKPKSDKPAKAKSQSIIHHPAYPHFAAPLKSFLINLLHLVMENQDEQTSRIFFRLLMSPDCTRLFEPQIKLVHKIMRHCLGVWSSASHSTRIDAFLCIRHYAIAYDSKHGLLEEAMKGIYLTYVKHARFTNALTIPVLEFMSNCVVELYSIDPVLSYQHAFVYIRQLAIHLRNALSTQQAAKEAKSGQAKSKKPPVKGKGKKSKDGNETGLKSVYNWQFINCLRVWTRVLSSPLASNPIVSSTGLNAGQSSVLRPLIYPFVQVAIGVLNLINSSRYHPLRLIVINFLIQLAASSHVFISVIPQLLSVFSSVELTRRPLPNSKKSHDIRSVLKVSKHSASTQAYQEQLCEIAMDSVFEYARVFSYSIAYPELILPVTRSLKKFAKQTKISGLSKKLNGLVAKLNENSSWIEKKRRASSYSPQDALSGKLDGLSSFRAAIGDEDQSSISWLDTCAKSSSSNNKNNLNNADWSGKSLSKKHDSDGEDDESDDDDGAMELEAGVESKDKRKPHSKLVDLKENGRHPSRQQMIEDNQSRESDEDQVTDLVFSDEDSD